MSFTIFVKLGSELNVMQLIVHKIGVFEIVATDHSTKYLGFSRIDPLSQGTLAFPATH